MKTIFLAALSAVAVTCASAAAAEPYVDYTPQKGYWSINAVEVDPNHVDDYLTGLRSSQGSAFEVLKRRGLIDDYKFMVRTGYQKGSPNVLIMTHVPSTALDDPDQVRDQAVQKEQDDERRRRQVQATRLPQPAHIKADELLQLSPNQF